MEFSTSTFTIEVNGEPRVVFQARLQSVAEEIGRAWTETNTQGGVLSTKVRLAHLAEREAFESRALQASGGFVYLK